MVESSKSIISYIPGFLEYCVVEKGLSDNTQDNYKQFLSKFVLWLKKNNKEGLKPHQLAVKDIWKYCLFLSLLRDQNTGKSLKKALRTTI